MKKFKVLALSAVVIAVFASCNKEEIKPVESSSVIVTHRYIQGDSEALVTYSFNDKDDLIKESGDLASRDAMIRNLKSETGMAILVDEVSEDGKNFTIRLFDTRDEMNEFQGIKEPMPQEETKNPCYNNGWSGYADFYFYRHTNYSDELTNLRRTDHAYFQIHYLDTWNENDQISSLQVYSGSVDLFKDGCFYGTQIRFQEDIPNLHWFHASADSDPNSTLDYWGSKPNGFFPANYNFGDQASSIKGWSL